ncbi:hypothetical protein G210_2604 [Candida maltosa Xu316]|uniref:Uncharacterized protein n=1 Tax=Candida maltosa (strain Xu316) TaxID=1245528 RepID=M3JXJ7_CANMX|nr:hypothetical protein G210_2604 [Candida maltosa Xu316]
MTVNRTKLSFFDLPDELHDIIFSFIPQSQLFKWKEIPEIQGLVLRNLYAKVGIWEYEQLHSDYDPTKTVFGKPDERKPGYMELHSGKDFLNLIKAMPSVRPKVLYVANKSILTQLIRDCPWILRSVKIELNLPLAFESNLEQQLTPEDINLFRPYHIDCLQNVKEGNPSSEAWKIVADCRRISVAFVEFDPYFFENHRFTNLKKLELQCSKLSGEHICLLPKTLTEFSGMLDMAATEAHYLLDFPPNLVRLIINHFYPGRNISFPIDISYLHSLKFVRIDSSLKETWILPKNMYEIQYDGELDMSTLHEDHPNLTSITHYPKKVDLQSLSNSGIKFPKRLIKIRLSSEYIFQKIVYSEMHGQKRRKAFIEIEFPPDLVELEVQNYKLFKNEEFGFCIDFDMYNLGSLQHLKLYRMHSVSVLGDTLNNLVSLTLYCFTPDDTFQEFLLTLDNLEVLECDQCGGGNRLCVPDKVKKLVLVRGMLSEFHLQGASVEILDLRSNCFRTIDGSTFELPPSVRRIDLSDNRIVDIEGSVRWPKNLTHLNLDDNNLRRLYNLPNSLEYLSASENKFDESFKMSVFPRPIVCLDLSSNKLKGIHLKSVNLVQYDKLKELNLSNNKLIARNFGKLLPASIKYLNLSSNLIVDLDHSLKTLKNLEEVDLRKNRLNRVLTNEITINRYKNENTVILI